MEFNNLLFEIKEKVALITINRPTKLNALNNETLTELDSLLNHVKIDKDIYVVIITGAGEKSFVAGADISELNKCDKSTGKDFAKKGQDVFNLIENLGKPVIAAVNGFALGGGCELALACHIRLASENAKFGQPEVNLGIIPGYGGTQRLARLVNTGRAAEIILTGDLLTADVAERIGLVNHVYSSEMLLSKAFELANKISIKGQIAVKSALSSIISTNNINQRDGLKLEAELFGQCCDSEDFTEGTSAFLEKRSPSFQNK
jgi:enoyl-CoA hydratase